MSLTPDQREKVFAVMDDDEIESWAKDWRIWARDEQLAPEGNWELWLILAGRGWGKTKTAVEAINDKVRRGEKGNLCLLGQGEDDVREVMVEGVSGFLRTAPNDFRPKWLPSRGGGLLEWPNGAVGHVFSAEDPEALRGPEFDLAWIDEFMAFKAAARQIAESNLRFGLRLGDNPQRIYTSTPKPHKWLREMVARAAKRRRTMRITRGTTFDNAENLPSSFLRGVRDDYDGTRLGQQELYGEILSDSDGALWTIDTLDRQRVLCTETRDGSWPLQLLQAFCRESDRVIVAVDPNMKPGGSSHAAGIVVIAQREGRQYVIRDLSMRGVHPVRWAGAAIGAYETFDADELVAERNQGGELVRTVINQVAKEMGVTVNVHLVFATKGKQRRAEPVATRYEQGKVFHMGTSKDFKTLETQMSDLHEAHDTTGEDFDRVDALVWGVTRLSKRAPSLILPGSGILTFKDFGAPKSGQTIQRYH